MASSQFCPNCGAPVPPSARFCQACGRPFAAPAYPQQAPPPVYPQQGPPPPAAYPQQVPPACPQAYPPAYPQAYVPARPRRRGTKVTLILVGILIFFIGVGGILLGVAGTKTQATITAVTLTDSTENQYDIQYQFSTRDGKTMVGSESRSGVLDISTLPDVGDSFTVRYLPFFPTMSMRDSSAAIITGIVGLVLGLGLIVIGARIS